MSLKPRRVNFDETWEVLRDTMQKVITLGSVEKPCWNDRFNDVYAICVAHPEPLADKLYFSLREFLEQHVTHVLKTKVIPHDGIEDYGKDIRTDETLLHRYYKAWSDFSLGMEYLNCLYTYLNQQHVKKQKISEAEILHGNFPKDEDPLEIGELGLHIWQNRMILVLKDELKNQLLEAIKLDRLGTRFDSNTIKVINGVILSFVNVQDCNKKMENLTLYETIFEKQLLVATSEFYKNEALTLLQSCSVSKYMEEILKRIEQEIDRSLKYLHLTSVAKIRKQCEERMITDHITFIYSECNKMVAQEQNTDLFNMYTLLKPITNGLKGLIEIFLEHIKTHGIESISNLTGENMHVQFVENMLDVHGKYEAMIIDTFQSDPLFSSALDKACSYIINKRINDKQPCRSAEMIAKYCDSLLKKSKTLEGEIDGKLKNSITVFKYIEDKDIYQKFYSRMLAKRLIHEQSQSMDAEEQMINRLKQACGYEFTNKLHRMFTDISLSTDLNNKFSNYLKETNQEIGINLAIKVLQAGAWPLGPTQVHIPFVVPMEFEKSIRLFENFYATNFSGRKLTWLHHLCHGEIKLTYLSKIYIVTMQTYQMAILLLFENCDVMKCKEIQETLQLQDDTFQKHIQSLIESKMLLSTSDELISDTEIKLNFDYTNKRTKFKITAALQKETPQEIAQTISSVDEDRKLYLQAAIVRIMKARKLLKHNALIQELLVQSKITFFPNVAMIKKCIESLIDKQYIERTSGGDEYSYVA